ncbi:NAD(P)/FAD-dependent oxidoreductase [Gracilibacillus phocaeensis]|uniref:NAD(P)/FAD-dependent oxidoreductase n=1 Tax=Gracilibacillus phocaeensis TaxID=2042304 RepID=UPI00102F47C1|nr:NAD(P)/FAD-dependent oxidoreductase [Gracilibacillus phocaeensis]
MYDVAIIGGGPSGLMAAIAAAEQGAHTLLIDKGNKLGKKLAISGGGRCNVTNRLPADEVIRHIPGNGRFLYSAFSTFDNYDIIDYFEGLGVALKEEDHGRMFPVSNQANDVVNALLQQLDRLSVTVRKNTTVQAIDYGESHHRIILADKENIQTKTVVVAAGGKAVPHTGSNGDAYPWAKKAGHTITTLYPTEVPIVSNEAFIRNKQLQGTALRDVALSVYNQKGKKVITHRMDMLFTHFGISGPAVLRCSQFIVKLFMQGEQQVKLSIDLCPDKTEQEITNQLQHLMKEHPKRTFRKSVKGIAPERLLDYLFDFLEIDPTINGANLSNETLSSFVYSLKHFSFYVHDSLPFKKAFVTGGGVSIKEITPNTMRSKCMDGLYFCGEVLDIHGYTGGYNITSALVTGRIAGMNAAWESFS